MTDYWKIVVANDDGSESEHLVRQDIPLAVNANQTVARFTSFLAGVDVMDEVLDPNWYLQMFCFIWAIQRLNPNWEVGRLLGAGIQTSKQLVGTGSISSLGTGGAQVDVLGVGAGDSVTVAGVLFTWVVSGGTGTQWTTPKQLAAAINANVPNVTAAVVGTTVMVRTNDTIWTNALLLAATYTVAAAGLTWERWGGAALAPGGQFNIEGDYLLTQITLLLAEAYFPDWESLRTKDLVTFTFSPDVYQTRIASVSYASGVITILLDTAQNFTNLGGASLVHPIAPVVPDEIAISYRRLPRFDDSPIWYMNEPVSEQTQRFIQQIYDLLKQHLFAVNIDYHWLIDQQRLDRLTAFLDRVRAVETNYVICSELPAVEEEVTPAVVESSPSFAANYLAYLAFLTIDVDFIETYIFGT